MSGDTPRMLECAHCHKWHVVAPRTVDPIPCPCGRRLNPWTGAELQP